MDIVLSLTHTFLSATQAPEIQKVHQWRLSKLPSCFHNLPVTSINVTETQEGRESLQESFALCI